MYNRIAIHIIRDGEADDEDAIVIIRKEETGEFSWTFKNQKAKPSADVCWFATSNEVKNQFSRMLLMLQLDEDPFKSVQFDFPGVPSILISVEKLEASRSILKHQLQAICENWPVKEGGLEPIVEETDYESEHEDGSIQTEDTSPNMPHLIASSNVFASQAWNTPADAPSQWCHCCTNTSNNPPVRRRFYATPNGLRVHTMW